jgi:dihydroorotate dehydrogenase electron transfer subunit
MTPPAPGRPGRFEAAVVDKVDLSRRYYLLVLERPRGFSEPEPGMFVHVLPPAPGRFFLRRPLSILDCDESTLSLVIVEKGPGTRCLRQVAQGERVDIIGPLGSAFPPLPGRRVLAVSGGVGLAPLYFYRARRFPERCAEYRLLYGARTREDLFLDRFAWRFGDIGYACEDGTYGFAGNVVDMAAAEIERGAFDAMFSCGPTPMLRAAAELARAGKIPHYVSLENRMGCGMGACRSCVVLTREGDMEKHETVCREGPVFDAERLVWEKLPEV